jgi:hypothetical protein
MNDKPRTDETVHIWLKLTRDEELDCDRFAQLLAPWLDGRVEDPRILELLEHHRRLCGECNEEVTLLKTALDET